MSFCLRGLEPAFLTAFFCRYLACLAEEEKVEEEEEEAPIGGGDMFGGDAGGGDY